MIIVKGTVFMNISMSNDKLLMSKMGGQARPIVVHVTIRQRTRIVKVWKALSRPCLGLVRPDRQTTDSFSPLNSDRIETNFRGSESITELMSVSKSEIHGPKLISSRTSGSGLVSGPEKLMKSGNFSNPGPAWTLTE